MLIIGLTGGIACGKSTVSHQIAAQGIPVIDADLIARQVVEPGTPAYQQVVRAFEPIVPGLVGADGSLNRAELGKAVFGDPQRLGLLNRIVHGAVKREMARQVFWLYVQGHAAAVLDVPLLFEAGLDRVCGTIITVTCNEKQQLERLLRRNPDLTKEDALKRIHSQISAAERAGRADLVICNDGTLQDLEQHVQTAMREVMPRFVWTALAYFPPWALVSAALTFVWRAASNWHRLPRPKAD